MCPYCVIPHVGQNCIDASQNKETFGTMKIGSQDWLVNLTRQLKNCVRLRNKILQMREDFLNLNVNWCHKIIQLEIVIANLKTNVKTKIGVCIAPLQEVKDSE